MQVEIKFEIDSHTITPQQLRNLLCDDARLAMLEQIMGEVRQKLHNVSCTVHEQPAHIVISIDSSGELKLNIAGCCQDLVTLARQRFKQHLVQTAYFAPRMKLFVFVEGEGEPLVFASHDIDTLVLGRSDPRVDEQPDIDLHDYDGLDRGISRRHAAIIWQSGALHLVDQGSANGTFLNGEHLEPLRPYILHSGDRITLGGLDLRIQLEFE